MVFDDEQYLDSELWKPDDHAVPPVIGRVDPATRKPLMRYDTSGEVTDPQDDREWSLGGGPAGSGEIDVSISFG